jgi:hypothetical protein
MPSEKPRKHLSAKDRRDIARHLKNARAKQYKNDSGWRPLPEGSIPIVYRGLSGERVETPLPGCEGVRIALPRALLEVCRTQEGRLEIRIVSTGALRIVPVASNVILLAVEVS